MHTLSKSVDDKSNSNHLSGDGCNVVHNSGEEIKKKCEAFIQGIKEQLDDYIASIEHLSIVEFVTFGTTLTKSRLKFAQTISNKLKEYLSAGNIFYDNNLRKLLNLISRTIEENNKKTGEFLIVAKPGRLQSILEVARIEVSNYCAHSCNSAPLVSKTDDSVKTKLGNGHCSESKVKQRIPTSTRKLRMTSRMTLPKWRSEKG